MKVQEFSSQLSILLNSYATAASFGRTDNPVTIELDEYEKSLFLTNAQEDIVLSLYNGRNSSLLSFEETEELRRYLSNLIAEKTIKPAVSTEGKLTGVDSRSKFFTLPPDLWFITYESVLAANGSRCEDMTTMEVVPVRQDEYHRIKKNPFRGANDRRALRLDLSEGYVEIVCKYDVAEYYVRYLKKLKPIILANLDGLELRGETETMTSELPESLHLRILDRAVEMALQSRGYTRSNNTRE